MSRNRELCLTGWVIDSYLLDNDLRFAELLDNKGALSFTIFILMRSMISVQNGYFAILNERFILALHKTLGRNSKGIEHIKAVIEYFGELGILDKSSLESNVLTSAEIQESWLIAKRAKRQRISSNLEHWLLVDTLPSTFDDNCSNNSDCCSKNNNNCNNNSLSCTQDKTRHDSKLINNIDKDSLEVCETYSADMVLDVVLNKDSTGRAMQAFKNHPNYEHYYKYAIYLAEACNDTRLNKYGGDDYYINNDFFIAWIRQIRHQELFEIFNECYRRHNDIKDSSAYYLRGIIYNKYKKLAIKHKKRFEI